MTKIKRIKILSFFLAILLLFSIPFTVKPAYAAESTTNFEETNVLDDLRSAPSFNILKYPFYNSGTPEMYLMNVVEYCYSFDPAMQSNYGLYLYIYNPNGLELSTKDGDNKVQMAVSYDANGNPNSYEKFDLKFCSKSEETFYEKLLYKFKVVDHTSSDGKTILQRVKSSERRYDISGIELLEYRKTLPVDYGVGGTYKFTGYARGFGANPNENTLMCNVIELETIKLEVHKTHYRTGEYKKNHRHDLTSVYFSVPERFFELYGNLQKIKAEWYEYHTTPIAVTSNTTVYDGLKAQIGVDVSKNSVPISLYSGWQELWNPGTGHYYSYDFGYNVYGEVNDRLNILNYVFSTNGENISEYVLSSGRLQSYIEGYTQTYTNGKIEIPGKTLSADLFEKDLAEDRKAVSYVGNDIHHKLMTFDAGDEFNMLNYNDTTTGGYRFLAWLFGLAPSELDQSYTGISPIHVVTDEERNDANIAKTLLIDSDDQQLKLFKDFYDREKENGNRTVLFRFAQTDYSAIPVMAYNEHTGKNLSGNYGNDTFVVQESVFLNFDIIELTFARDGVYTVIPVVSSPIDIYNDITIPKVEDPYAWLKILIIVLLAILLIIFLWVTGLLPLVIKGIVWLILLPFRLIIWLFKAIFKKRKKKDKNENKES